MKVWELIEILRQLDDYLDVEVDGRQINMVKRTKKEFSGRVVVRIFTLEGGKQ